MPVTMELTARLDLPTLVDRVPRENEGILFTRNGQVVAELRPALAPFSSHDLVALIQSGPRLGAEEAEAFAKDLDEARREIESLGVPNRWDS